MSCATIWYYGKPRPISTSVKRLAVNHLGSVAKGSFILAVVWLIQVIFEYLASKIEGKAGTEGAVSFGIKCIRCCLACFEKCIRYLNRNAYTVIALKGIDFCPAALDVFGLIIRNPVRFAVVGGMGAVFTVFG